MTKTLTNHRTDGCYSLGFIFEQLKNALRDISVAKDEKLSVWTEHQKKKKESKTMKNDQRNMTKTLMMTEEDEE